MTAENNQTQWNWHGAFPWVYSHLEKGWHYWHAGRDGNFYRWKDSNKTWYHYDQNLEKWSVVSSVVSASNSSSSDSSEKYGDDNWWDYFDKSDDSSKDNSTNTSGETLNLSLQHDGLTREYLLYVPSSYNGNSAVPLLFNFHGYGGTSSDHLSTADMRSLADQENFLLCYPQGSSDSYGSGHWNAALPSGDNKSTADDTGFVSAMITSISSSYQVDSTRIYACGYSNGGMMSYFLGGSMSEKIAAIGSVSGSMLEGNPDPTNPVPMINFHGTADYVLTYSGGDGSTSTTDTLSYWATRNGASTTPVITNMDSGNLSVQKSVYSDSNGTVWVEHYKVINGGHVWFDFDLNGSDTNQLLWDFFEKHDLDGPR
ncbi:MAG: PHB depolymerase family esterase [Verrucomicrobiota bacterium]|nr:PHB depolymerase family esterase [Verrucomicrobiota bacterium]